MCAANCEREAECVTVVAVVENASEPYAKSLCCQCCCLLLLDRAREDCVVPCSCLRDALQEGQYEHSHSPHRTYMYVEHVGVPTQIE